MSTFDLVCLPDDLDPEVLYEEAQGRERSRAAVFSNGDEHVATPGDHCPISKDPVFLHRNPITFAHALSQTALSAPLYDTTNDDGVHTYGVGLIVSPRDADVVEYLYRHTSDHVRTEKCDLQWMGLQGHDGEYIDGWSVHPGHIFKKGDYEYVMHRKVSEPMALDNPDEHLRQIARSDDKSTTKLLDVDHALDAGWELHDPISISREKFQKRMKGTGHEVIFFDSDSGTKPWLPVSKAEAELA